VCCWWIYDQHLLIYFFDCADSKVSLKLRPESWSCGVRSFAEHEAQQQQTIAGSLLAGLQTTHAGHRIRHRNFKGNAAGKVRGIHGKSEVVICRFQGFDVVPPVVAKPCGAWLEETSLKST